MIPADSRWIDITRDILSDSHVETLPNGVKLNIFISPTRAPNAIRGDFDSESGVFTIMFKYLDSEKLIEKKASSHVKFFIGASSNRVFKIEIDTQKLSPDSVRLNLIHEKIHDALEEIAPSLNSSNSRITDKVIKSHSNELFSSLAKAI